MSLFLWKAEYAIDQGTIDNEHQRLFGMARHILDLELGPDKLEEFKTIVREFYDYTATHFEHEERYMTDIHYPDLNDHKAKHKAIISEMNHYLSTDRKFSLLLSNFKSLAVKWVFDHILDEDLKIKKFLTI
ncbi:MAG: hemerythrin family protein [Candidatus Marinimicrobia bacterium]|nr:hemerythrin family protein [Candidatus Neomarinimicrobiota bacterium]MCF7851579.1 hemerythrin family protein [Candidatus Neomarinimicrobiota bacterium]